MAHNITLTDWCSRRDDLQEIAMGMGDVLCYIGRLKGMHTEDMRFYDAMTEIGSAIFAQYLKTADEITVCNVEIDRLQKPKD